MITATFSPDLVRGVAELEPTERGTRPHRLPSWARGQFPDAQLLAMESQLSGARLVVRTSASRIELATYPTYMTYRGAERPRGRLDVYLDGGFLSHDVLTGGDRIEVDLQSGASSFHPGTPHTTVIDALPDGDHLVEVWLPHNEALELVALRADAPIEPDTSTAPLWVHHGSSISQGSNAASPSKTWPAVASRLAGVELRNLGFGGSAMVDPFMARVIRDTPADVISVKLGINVVNLDAMHLRAFVPAVHGFLDTIREGHPTTPVMVISPIFCAIHETTAGPAAVDPASLGTDQVRFIATGPAHDAANGRLTLTAIRRELASLVEGRADDANLHHLDGRDLYGAPDTADLPLLDALHPGPDAHLLIGQRFADLAFTGAGPFATA